MFVAELLLQRRDILLSMSDVDTAEFRREQLTRFFLPIDCIQFYTRGGDQWSRQQRLRAMFFLLSCPSWGLARWEHDTFPGGRPRPCQ